MLIKSPQAAIHGAWRLPGRPVRALSPGRDMKDNYKGNLAGGLAMNVVEC